MLYQHCCPILHLVLLLTKVKKYSDSLALNILLNLKITHIGENENTTKLKGYRNDHKMNKTLANIDIFVGTYDSYLLSYKIKTHNEVNLYIFNSISDKSTLICRFSKLCFNALSTKILTRVPYVRCMALANS